MSSTETQTALEKTTIRRVALRLVPFLMFGYFIAFLDRVNAGFAALQMNKAIGLSHAAFGIGGGLFFISYIFFEIPSNLALEKFGARLWIARIMVTWGIVSGCMALVVGPYAAGLACLVEDESELGVTVIDMGGGTTTIAVFFDGNLVFTDSVPVGGIHVTNDIARGLSTPLVHAERLKTLHGSAITSSSDEREMISVPLVGEEDDGQSNHVPKSLLIGIIAPRLEETFELVRDRLESSGFDKIVGRRIVLTGGACQLPGTRELAALILDKQIRIGRPRGITGLAEATGGPAFTTAAGLIHFALSERAEIPRQGRARAEESNGLIGRFGHWIREYL